MVTFITAIISAMLINNVILMQYLGICPFLGVSKKTESAIGMGMAVIFVMLLSSIFTFIIYHYLLVPAKIEYMNIIVFILIIASLVQFVEIVLKKMAPGLYKSLGVYLPLISTNCAILGIAQGNIDNQLNFIDAMANTIGTGLGFALVLFVFSAIRMRLEAHPTTKSFRGVPISLITAGIMALAFMGLSGLL